MDGRSPAIYMEINQILKKILYASMHAAQLYCIHVMSILSKQERMVVNPGPQKSILWA